MKMGQTNMHNYMKPLLERIERQQIDPSYIISHRITLDEAPGMYKIWRDKKGTGHQDRDRSVGGESSRGYRFVGSAEITKRKLCPQKGA